MNNGRHPSVLTKGHHACNLENSQLNATLSTPRAACTTLVKTKLKRSDGKGSPKRNKESSHNAWPTIVQTKIASVADLQSIARAGFKIVGKARSATTCASAKVYEYSIAICPPDPKVRMTCWISKPRGYATSAIKMREMRDMCLAIPKPPEELLV